jgi:hypothetical protein
MKQEQFKECPDCLKTKNIENDFYNMKSMSTGKDSICKECRRERNKEYNKRNKERNVEYSREYRRKRNNVIPENYKTTNAPKAYPVYDVNSYPKQEGIIYILKECNITGHYKIGKTFRPSAKQAIKKFSDLPFEIKMEVVYDSVSEDIHKLHRLLHMIFQEKRVRGEWFDFTPEEVTTVIQAIEDGIENQY